MDPRKSRGSITCYCISHASNSPAKEVKDMTLTRQILSPSLGLGHSEFQTCTKEWNNVIRDGHHDHSMMYMDGIYGHRHLWYRYSAEIAHYRLGILPNMNKSKSGALSLIFMPLSHSFEYDILQVSWHCTLKTELWSQLSAGCTIRKDKKDMK